MIHLLHTYATVNFLHFAVFLFVVCAAVLIVVSLLSAPPSEAQIAGLTYSTATKTESDPAWRRRDLILSIILAAVVGLVWIYFKG